MSEDDFEPVDSAGYLQETVSRVFDVLLADGQGSPNGSTEESRTSTVSIAATTATRAALSGRKASHPSLTVSSTFFSTSHPVLRNGASRSKSGESSGDSPVAYAVLVDRTSIATSGADDLGSIFK
ncbi:hypothetical protein OBBRIDRAFT_38218 [Obba rivulosa]|uniref:Uncharacterized protein n=1 Tax=Obba rivulosa TaxID=1052685 RepID=A0A8E2B0W2_9APHY|nr:hypothetical protein OBBRIDRAFT_38218 [Obba rivulosa]